MISLIIVACLVSDPDVCQEYSLPFMAENVTPMECLMNGQVEIAKFMEGKPSWRVVKFRCSKPETEGQGI